MESNAAVQCFPLVERKTSRHLIAQNVELPIVVLAGVRRATQRALLGVILARQRPHEFRVAIHDLVAVHVHLFGVFLVGSNLIEDVLIVAGRVRDAAFRLAFPRTGDLGQFLGFQLLLLQFFWFLLSSILKIYSSE